MNKQLWVGVLCLLVALALAPAVSVAQESDWDYWGEAMAHNQPL